MMLACSALVARSHLNVHHSMRTRTRDLRTVTPLTGTNDQVTACRSPLGSGVATGR